jgi:hypothetical protein
MRVNASPFRISLRWGRPLTFADAEGTCITARRGTVWITQDNDIRDVVLGDGESFMLDQPDLAVVQAFHSAEILIRPPGSPGGTGESQPPLSQRILRALRRRATTAPRAVMRRMPGS